MLAVCLRGSRSDHTGRMRSPAGPVSPQVVLVAPPKAVYGRHWRHKYNLGTQARATTPMRVGPAHDARPDQLWYITEACSSMSGLTSMTMSLGLATPKAIVNSASRPLSNLVCGASCRPLSNTWLPSLLPD